jgi:hypothetical protein
MNANEFDAQLFQAIATANLAAITRLVESSRGKFSFDNSDCSAFLQFLRANPPHDQVADLVKLLDDCQLFSKRCAAFRLIDLAIANRNRSFLLLAVKLAEDLDVSTELELARYSGLIAILKHALDRGVDLEECLRREIRDEDGKLSFIEFILNYGKNTGFKFDLNAAMTYADGRRDVGLVALLTRFGAAPLQRQLSLDGAMEGRRVDKDGYWIDPDPVTGRW